MGQDEILDIFDEKMTFTGTAARWEAHALGLWHQTFHCWIITRSPDHDWQILLQLRHKNKDTYPDKLDVSCAGHLLSGEAPRDGLRELAEELGLAPSYEELAYAGIAVKESFLPGKLTDREFSHIHIYECPKPLQEYKVQLSEVSGLFRVRLGEFRRLTLGETDSIQAEGIVYNSSQDGERHTWVSAIRNIGRADLSPNSSAYYRMLFAGIDAFRSKEEEQA